MRTYHTFLAASVLAILIGGPHTMASADDEFVALVRILPNVDKGIVVRRDGDAYQIEKGVGCVSFWRYEAKAVLISSPATFLGIGSELTLPKEDQKCRILDSKKLGPWNLVQKGLSTERPRRPLVKPTPTPSQ